MSEILKRVVTSFNLSSFEGKIPLLSLIAVVSALIIVSKNIVLSEAPQVVEIEINCGDTTSPLFYKGCFIDLMVKLWFPNYYTMYFLYDS